jgi:hypothetical protein
VTSSRTRVQSSSKSSMSASLPPPATISAASYRRASIPPSNRISISCSAASLGDSACA